MEVREERDERGAARAIADELWLGARHAPSVINLVRGVADEERL
jgi:hypothetical protein